MELNEVQKKRLEIERQYWEFAKQMSSSKDGCKHTNIAKGRLIWSPAKNRIVQTHEDWIKSYPKADPNDASMFCQDCDTGFGWFCPDSPQGYCVYDWEKHGENCIYCGNPEERK